MKFLSINPTPLVAPAFVNLRDQRARGEQIPYLAPAQGRQATPVLPFTDTVTKKSEKPSVAAFERTQTIFPAGEENVNQTWTVKPISSRYQ